jgi:hypothetical protein
VPTCLAARAGSLALTPYHRVYPLGEAITLRDARAVTRTESWS